jgi:hypothetical protein
MTSAPAHVGAAPWTQDKFTGDRWGEFAAANSEFTGRDSGQH